MVGFNREGDGLDGIVAGRCFNFFDSVGTVIQAFEFKNGLVGAFNCFDRIPFITVEILGQLEGCAIERFTIAIDLAQGQLVGKDDNRRIGVLPLSEVLLGLLE